MPRECRASAARPSAERARVALAKAYGVIRLGADSRAIAAGATDSAEVVTSVTAPTDGTAFSGPGGVVVHDQDGTLLGAAGASGDVSAADEEAVVDGIRAAGPVPRTGAEE